ncbi:MAG: helix-turn-helix domain-containing protein [Eggerthellaceae bacterium]|nr:helix-turn-helix domain-containing protein [Eggerthellaceae bacterium]
MAATAFARNIKAMRESRDLTQMQLSDEVGVSRLTVNKWERGDIERPRQPEVIDRLKEYFGVTDSDLFGYNDGYYAKKYGLTERPAGALAANPEPRKAYAPLLGRVHAGDAQEPDVLDSKIPLPYEVWERHKRGYFLEVEGTCMNRVYPEGCRVFIDPDKAPQNGSIAVVSIDDMDYIMRRLYVGSSSIMLVAQSFDNGWDDIIVKDNDKQVKMVGTVVWYQPSEELE